MSSENLNEGNLQGWDFAVHENSCQIELDLETNVDIGPENKTENFIIIFFCKILQENLTNRKK